MKIKLDTLLTAVTLAAILAGISIQGISGHEIAETVIYTVAFVAGGWFGVQNAFRNLLSRKIDVDLLMILAALGAASIGQAREGAILLFLFSLSNALQNYALDRSRNAIQSLLKLRPNEAEAFRNGEWQTVGVDELVVGDVVLLHPGERFPADGTVVKGSSSADQSTITGESMPVVKTIGDKVFEGTVNQNGTLEVRVELCGEQTMLSRIIGLVEVAQNQKAKTQRFLERFENLYALSVLAFVAVMIVVPTFVFHEPFAPTFYRAMVLLTVASPCALIISTPASILSAIAHAARKGILFKGGASLEQISQVKVVAFDKTGTLTLGKPVVTRVLPVGNISEKELLRIAASLETLSEHPVAQAVVEYQKNLYPGDLAAVEAFENVPGKGVWGTIDRQTVVVGNEKLFQLRSIELSEGERGQHSQLEREGKTVLMVWKDRLLGFIGVEDALREGAEDAVRALRAAGVKHIVLLTGDNAVTAEVVGKTVGTDEVRASLLPEDKLNCIKELEQKYGPTVMIGDGINDAPALAAASVGLAMGVAGTDVALETADVVLMSSDLSKIAYVIELSHRTRRTMIQNLAFSMAVIAVLVGAALGISIPLTLGVVAHEGSTLLVCLNGLRLLGFRPKRTK